MAGPAAPAIAQGAQRLSLAEELGRDINSALRRLPAWLFLGCLALGAIIQVWRGGPDRLPLVALLAIACVFYGFIGWFAGRSPRASPEPDPVRAPRAELTAAILAYVGLAGYYFGFGLLPLFLGGIGAMLGIWLAVRYRPADFGWLLRDWLPFLPLMLAVAIPRFLIVGPAMLVNLHWGLLSGILQQLLLQVGLLARIEAVSRRSDVAVVLAALAFAVVHAGHNIPQAGGDRLLALSATLVLQAPIGLAFCIAFLRHRSPIALGIVHGLIISQ
ncbi:MAG TPA: CPBP family glutamic-type intramembrane protease [Candidatus Limnocylindria bacterium]|nr:CPBP family glutamic-type intramembrane protease [Candidatus Limnocylindria bacterium]